MATNRRRLVRWAIWLGVILGLYIVSMKFVGSLRYYESPRVPQDLNELDTRIARDVEQAVVAKLQGLTADDDINAELEQII